MERPPEHSAAAATPSPSTTQSYAGLRHRPEDVSARGVLLVKIQIIPAAQLGHVREGRGGRRHSTLGDSHGSHAHTGESAQHSGGCPATARLSARKSDLQCARGRELARGADRSTKRRENFKKRHRFSRAFCEGGNRAAVKISLSRSGIHAASSGTRDPQQPARARRTHRTPFPPHTRTHEPQSSLSRPDRCRACLCAAFAGRTSVRIPFRQTRRAF